MAGTYKYEIDWEDTLGFQGAYDDITSRVMKSTYSRGKNQELQKANTGRAQFQVDNNDGLFSPTLATGNLYGNLKPRRRVRITETSVPGYAIELDGASGYGKVTDSASIQNIWDGGGTASVWVYVDSDGEANVGRILDKTKWYLNVNSEAVNKVKVTFWIDFDGVADGQWTTAATEITLAAWTKIDITYDSDAVANNPTIAINDVDKTVGGGLTEDTTPVGTRVTDAASDLYIGNNSADSNTFDGKIDQPEIYNRTLAGAEKTANYNSGAGLKTPSNKQGLVLWMHFDEDFGTTAYDNSPYQNHAALTSCTWADGHIPLEPALFEGYIEHISPSPYWNKQYCDIYCVDGLDFLARASITSSLMKSKDTGYLVNEALTISEWDGVPRDGLVGWWSFDPWTIDGATVRDLSPEGNDGTDTGTPDSTGSHWGYCNARSHYYDTSLQRTYAGAALVAADGTASVSAFVRFTASALAADTYLFSNFFLDVSHSNYLTVDSGGDYFAWAPVADKWYWVCVTYDGGISTAILYVRDMDTFIETTYTVI